MQRILAVLFGIIATLAIMGCSYEITKNHDRFGTGYGHKGKTADTVEIPLPFPDVNIGGNKIPHPPGYVIKNAHCSGDSIQFSLTGKNMITMGDQVTIAIGDLVFLYHLGVKGNPQLDIERTLSGMQYTCTVYCRDWEQKKQFFPCLAY